MARRVIHASATDGFPVADVINPNANVWRVHLKPDAVYYFWDIRGPTNAPLMLAEPGEPSGGGKGMQILYINASLVDCLLDLGRMLTRCFDYLKGSDRSAPKPVKWADITSITLVGVRYQKRQKQRASDEEEEEEEDEDKGPDEVAPTDLPRVTLDRENQGSKFVGGARIQARYMFTSPENTMFVDCLRIPLYMPTFRFMFSDPSNLRSESEQAKIKRAEGMIANALNRYERMGSASYRLSNADWEERGREANPMGASIDTLFPHLTRSLNNDNPETEWLFIERFITQRASARDGRQRRGINTAVPDHRAIQIAATIHFLAAFLEGANTEREKQPLRDMVRHQVTMMALAVCFGEPQAGMWIALSATKASDNAAPPLLHATYWSNGADNQVLKRVDAQTTGTDKAQLRISFFDSAQKRVVSMSVREALLAHGFVAGSAAFTMHDAPLFFGLMERDKDVTEFDAMLGQHIPESVTSILRIIPHVCLTDDRAGAPGMETLLSYICDPYSDATPQPRMQGWRALLRKIMAIVVSEGPTRIKGGTYVLPLKVSARDATLPLIDLRGIFPLYPNYSTRMDSNQLVSDGPFAGSKLRAIRWRTFLASEILEHVFRRHLSFRESSLSSSTRNMQTIIKFAHDGFNEVGALCMENGCVHTPLAWLQWIVDHRGAEMAHQIAFGAFLRHLTTLGALLRSQGVQTGQDHASSDPLVSELRKLIQTPLRDYISSQRIGGGGPSVNQIVENPTLGLIEAVAQWTGPFPHLITNVIVQSVPGPGFSLHPKLIIERLEAMKMPVAAELDYESRHLHLPELPPGASDELTAPEVEMLRVSILWVSAVRRHIDLLNEMINESRQRMPPGASLPKERIVHIGELLDIRMDLMVGRWRDRGSMKFARWPAPVVAPDDGDLRQSWAAIFSGALVGSPFATAEREVFAVRDYERLYMPENAPGFELSANQKKLWGEARSALIKAARYGIKFHMNWLEMISHERERWTPPIWFTAIPYDEHLYLFLELLEVGTEATTKTRELWMRGLTPEERHRVVRIVDDPKLIDPGMNPAMDYFMRVLLERYNTFSGSNGVSRRDTVQQIRCWRNPLNRLLLLALTNKRTTLARRILEIHVAMDNPGTVSGVTGHIDDVTFELGITTKLSLARRAWRVQDATFTASMLAEAPRSLLASEAGIVQNQPGTLAIMVALQARNGTMLRDILTYHAFDRVRLQRAQQDTIMPRMATTVNENLFPARVLSIYELASTWLLWNVPISLPVPVVASADIGGEEGYSQGEHDGGGGGGGAAKGDAESDESSERNDDDDDESEIDAFIMTQLTTAVETTPELTRVAAGELAPIGGGGGGSVVHAVADVNLYRTSAATAKTRPVSGSLIQGLVNHAQLAALPLRARSEEINARLVRENPVERERNIHEAMHMAHIEARSVCKRKQEDWTKHFNAGRQNTISMTPSMFHASDAMLARIVFDATHATEGMIPPDLARLAIFQAPVADRLKRTMAQYVRVLESVPSVHDAEAAAKSTEELSRASDHMEIVCDTVPTTDAAAMTTREARESTNTRLNVQTSTRRAVAMLPRLLEDEQELGLPPTTMEMMFPKLPASDEPEEEENEGGGGYEGDIMVLERADIPDGTELPNPMELASLGGRRVLAREEDMLLQRATALRLQQHRELHTSSIEGLIAAATPLVMCALCANRITLFSAWLKDGRTMNALPNHPWLESMLPVRDGVADIATTAPTPVQTFFQSTFFWGAWEWSLRLFAPLNLADRVKRAISQFVLGSLMMPYQEPILTETDLLRYTANDPQLHGYMHDNVVELSKQMHNTTNDPATQEWLARPIYWGDTQDITKTERRWNASHGRVSTFTLEKLAPTDASRPWSAVTPFIISSTRRLLTNMSRRYHASNSSPDAVGVYQKRALMTTVGRVHPTAVTAPQEVLDTFITVVTPYLVRNYWTSQFNGRTAMASLMSTLGEGDPSHAELINIFTQLLLRFVPDKMLRALNTEANYTRGRLDMHNPFDTQTIAALATVLSDMATARNTFFDADVTPPWYAVPACTTPDRTAEVQILAYILFGIQPLGNDAGQFRRAMLEFKRRYHDILQQHEDEFTEAMDTTT